MSKIRGQVPPALLGYFVNRVRNVDDAADLVSETMTAAWKSARKAPADAEQARMWLFGIARNMLRHHNRSKSRRDAATAKLAAALESAAVANPSHDEALDLRAAIEGLPSNEAELIRLVHWDGFNIEEAAKHLGIPSSTARSRHARAKQHLQEAIATTHA